MTARATLAIGLVGLLLVGACRTPLAAPTAPAAPTPAVLPTPTASPAPPATPTTPTPTPETALPSPPDSATPATPLPSPTATPTSPEAITRWAAEICLANEELVSRTEAIMAQVPEPAEPASLDAQQAVTAQRQPLVEQLLEAVAGRLEAIAPIAEGEPLHDALQAEMSDRDDAAQWFFEAVRAATTLDDYEAAVLQQAAEAQAATFRTARTIYELPETVVDAIAAQDDCRSFELDARGVPRDLAMPEFPTEPQADDLLDEQAWALPEFPEGAIEQADGRITAIFDGPAVRQLLSPPQIGAADGDVRVEALLEMEGLGFSGVYCHGSEAAGYAAQVTATGLLLLLRSDGEQQTTLARRVLEEGRVMQPLTLALECAGGQDGMPLRLVANLEGERVAEFEDQQPPAGLGSGVGLVAHTLGVGESVTVFESLRVITPVS